MQQLREEESSLRQENLRLKEELLKMKHSAGIQPPTVNKYAPPEVQQQNISMMHVVFAIAIAVLGFALGKFILWAAVRQCTDYTVACNLSNLLYIYFYFDLSE